MDTGQVTQRSRAAVQQPPSDLNQVRTSYVLYLMHTKIDLLHLCPRVSACWLSYSILYACKDRFMLEYGTPASLIKPVA